MRHSHLLAVLLAFTLVPGCLSYVGQPAGDARFGGSYTAPFGTITYPAPGYGPITEIGSKEGVACATKGQYFPIAPFYPALVRGDSSIPTAARFGKITQIKSVSYRYSQPTTFFLLSWFYLETEICTIVTGD